MLIGATAQRPVKLSVAGLDRQVVDAGDAPTHVAALVELPVLVAVRAKPVPGIVMPLIGKAHGDAIAVKGPQFLDEPVIQLPAPLADQALPDGLATRQEFRPVTPRAVWRVSKRHAVGVAGIPGVLGHAN